MVSAGEKENLTTGFVVLYANTTHLVCTIFCCYFNGKSFIELWFDTVKFLIVIPHFFGPNSFKSFNIHSINWRLSLFNLFFSITKSIIFILVINKIKIISSFRIHFDWTVLPTILSFAGIWLLVHFNLWFCSLLLLFSKGVIS